MGHTKGPWSIGETLTDDWNNGMIEIKAKNELSHAWVSPENARLIAAAPELLEALESAHEVLVNKIDQDRYFYRDKLIEKLWTAIQKARGE